MTTELYQKYRPKHLSDIVGQEQAVNVLKTKLATKTLPHVVLLVGSTGVGKTSIAHILARELGCTDQNLTAVNVAQERGIEIARDMNRNYRLSPMGGTCRVYIWEEAVQLPKATQQASLSTLEECPSHVWVFLCTTSTEGMLATFLGRCFVVQLRALHQNDLAKILLKVLSQEKRDISEVVVREIIGRSNGSARTALQLLEMVLTGEDECEQLQILGVATLKEEEQIEFLAKALLRGAPWREITPILTKIEEKDAIGIRCKVMAYAATVMLNSKSKNDRRPDLAHVIIANFSDNWPVSCHRSCLIDAAWQCCQHRGTD